MQIVTRFISIHYAYQSCNTFMHLKMVTCRLPNIMFLYHYTVYSKLFIFVSQGRVAKEMLISECFCQGNFGKLMELYVLNDKLGIL